MTRLLAVLCPVVLLAACQNESADPAPQGTTAAPRQSTTASAAAAASGGGASAVSESTSAYEFDYSYPAEAGRIPELKTWLDAQRDAARKQLVADAKDGQQSAKEGGYEYHAYAYGRKWLKVAETPRFLSLSAELYDYQGGAHPNHGYDALLWDKRAGTRLTALDLFASPGALDTALASKFCKALDAERAKRRGEPVTPGEGTFSDCIKASEQTVILGSSDGRAFDKVGVLIGPYAAGSYAEGDYEFTFPVDRALLGAVKPAYRNAFALRR